MRATGTARDGRTDLFRSRLDQIIDLKHPPVVGAPGGLGLPGRALRRGLFLRRVPDATAR